MTRLTSPPATERVLDGARFALPWWRLVSRVTSILAGREPLQLAERAIADLPDADKWKHCLLVVTDDAGGPCLAVSDGAIWRRAYDNAEVGT